MTPRILLTLCCLIFSASSMYGQAAPPADTATELRKNFTEVSVWVTQAAELVPGDKYNYRPIDSVRTFGELVVHITNSYNYFCAQGAGNDVKWVDPMDGSTDKAAAVAKLKQATDRCNEVYKGNSGRVGPLLGNIGHTSLHYGNMITYIRMLGMKPPSS